MKKILIFSLLIIFIIFITPKNFHNDATNTIDKLLIASTIANFCISMFNNKIYNNKLFHIVLLQFLCVISTVTSNDELNYYQLRIITLFFNGNTINSTILLAVENIYYLSFVFLLIYQSVTFFLIIKTRVHKKV